MSDSGKKARELFEDRDYNCAEAVWLGMNQDLSEADQALTLRLATGFGGGAACGSICGAVAGAVMSIGRWYGRELGGPRADDAKALTKEFVDKIIAEYGSIDCRDMKPKTAGYRQVCAGYVEHCARLALELIDRGPETEDCG